MLRDSLCRLEAAVQRLEAHLAGQGRGGPHAVWMQPTPAAPPSWQPKLVSIFPSRVSAEAAAAKLRAFSETMAEHRRGRYEFIIREA